MVGTNILRFKLISFSLKKLKLPAGHTTWNRGSEIWSNQVFTEGACLKQFMLLYCPFTATETFGYMIIGLLMF